MRYFIKYLSYLLHSRHRHGFGIHSPYVYYLMTNVIEEELPYYKYSLIEKVRNVLLKTDEKIGVFMPNGEKKLKKIEDVVSQWSIGPKYGQLLFRLVNYSKAKTIIEYGSTSEITTMYLAAPDSKSKVLSITNQPELADLSHSMQERIDMKNIEQMVSSDNESVYRKLTADGISADFIYFSRSNPSTLYQLAKLQMVPAVHKFIVIAGIHRTPAMEMVWSQLTDNSEVKVSLDLFEVGILILNPDLQKEKYIVYF